MKKVYLVKALLKDDKQKQGSIVNVVFANKRKAKAYCDFFNSSKHSNFYYYIEEQTICEYDFRNVPY